MFCLFKNIPNILSFSRILLVPFVLFFLASGSKILVVFLLFLGALSDFLDGYIARKMKLESDFGQLIDPIADKIFCNTILWGLFAYEGRDKIVLFVAIVLSLRDILLLFGGAFVLIKKISVQMSPTYMSKINTSTIFLLMIASIYRENCLLFCQALGGFCLLMTTMTMIFYVKRFFWQQTKKTNLP